MIRFSPFRQDWNSSRSMPMALTRRRFLTYLGFGTYAALINPPARSAPQFPLRPRRKCPFPFKEIKPSKADDLLLPDGFDYHVVAVWGDSLGTKGPEGPEAFGFNNDFLAYFPIDALQKGHN